MKIGRVFMLIGLALGTFVAFWLLSQRRIPTLRVSYTLGRGREVSLDWIELE
jgi:hypothetical protein